MQCQRGVYRIAVQRQPIGQAGKLARMRRGQVLPPVLGTHAAIWRQREAQVGAVELFFDRDVVCQQLLHFGGTEHLVLAWHTRGQPVDVCGLGKAEKFSHGM